MDLLKRLVNEGYTIQIAPVPTGGVRITILRHGLHIISASHTHLDDAIQAAWLNCPPPIPQEAHP